MTRRSQQAGWPRVIAHPDSHRPGLLTEGLRVRPFQAPPQTNLLRDFFQRDPLLSPTKVAENPVIDIAGAGGEEVPAHLAARNPASSERCRVNDRDRKSPKMIRVEGKQSRDSIALHCCHEPRVERPDAGNALRLNQVMPSRKQFFAVAQECESPQEELQPLAGLVGRHSEAVLSARRQAGFARGHSPKLVQILRNNNGPFAASEK